MLLNPVDCIFKHFFFCVFGLVRVIILYLNNAINRIVKKLLFKKYKK